MKSKIIFVFLLINFIVIAQIDSSNLDLKSNKQLAINDSISKEKTGLFVGVDLLKPLQQIWDQGSGYEIYANMRVYKKYHAAAEIGYSKDKYTKAGWDADEKGTYLKLGVNYSIKETKYSKDDFFYTGIRLAYGTYNQTINQYRITATDVDGNQSYTESSTGLPTTKLNALWTEIVIGARTSIGQTNFYLDTQLRPKILLSAKKQDGINPLLIPGFGKEINNANISLSFTLGYKIPLLNQKERIEKESKDISKKKDKTSINR